MVGQALEDGGPHREGPAYGRSCTRPTSGGWRRLQRPFQRSRRACKEAPTDLEVANLPPVPPFPTAVDSSTGGTGGETQRLHVRYALWDVTGCCHDYSLAAWRDQATEEQLSVPGCRLYFPGYGFVRQGGAAAGVWAVAFEHRRRRGAGGCGGRGGGVVVWAGGFEGRRRGGDGGYEAGEGRARARRGGARDRRGQRGRLRAGG